MIRFYQGKTIFSNGAGNAADTMLITSAGRVGIGTSSPSTKLEVAWGVTATAFIYTSDRNLKKDLVKIDSPLEKIQQLNGYNFTWKNDGKKSIWVIAQEIETVFPEIVHTDKDTGLKSVEYGNLVAPLIEAVKELKKENDEQKKEIMALQKVMSNLKK